MSGAWGSGTWGSGSWGGGVGVGVLDFVEAVALRENVIRVEFDDAVNVTGLLDATDASVPDNWVVIEDASTTGMSGDPARPVVVVFVELSGEGDGIVPGDVGRFVNLVLDRPMTPWPAGYVVSFSNIYILGGTGDPVSGQSSLQSTYRILQPPTIEEPRPSRDFANPQTLEGARDPIPFPEDALRRGLGTFEIGGDGDIALDEGQQSLVKRVFRRLFSKKNSFVHLPGYGIDVPSRAKKLGTQATISELQRDCEIQVAREPEVLETKARIAIDSSTPNLARLRIAIRPKVGSPFAFSFPFEIGQT